MPKVFIAYPAQPPEIGEAIRAAKALADGIAGLDVNLWERDDLGGQQIIGSIISQIVASDIVVGDISRSNFNVTYEMAYAYGLGKRVLPIVHGGLAGMEHISEIGLFDTIAYETYANSQDLLKLISQAAVGQRIATDYPKDPQPLYLVVPPVKTDDVDRLITRCNKAGLRARTFDPSEQPRLSAPEAVRAVSASSGVVVPLLGLDAKGRAVHNIRCAFVAGVAHALELPTLLLQKGTWTAPMDVRDAVRPYTTDEHAAHLFNEFAEKAHNQRYAAKLPGTGAENALAVLNLGDPAAENEEAQLDNYFLERDEFRQVLMGRANIVVGRKGSGKSAVFFEVRSRLRQNRANVVVDLSPEAYQLRKLKDVILRFLAAGSKEFLLSAFWEYVLLLEICGKLIEKDQDVHKRNHNLFEPYQRLLKYYRAETATEGLSFSDRLLRLIERLAQRYTDKFGDAADVDLSDNALTNILYATTIHELRQEVVNYVRVKDGVALLFDNIDKGWNASGLEGPDVIMIRTLLDAARKLGNDFRRAGTEFFCTVFLRNDIYDVLLSGTSDRGKDNVVLIDWLQADLLKQMVRKRLLYNNTNKAAAIEELWHKYCVPMVGGESSLTYLVNLCMMRPRYLLRLINNCRGNAINFGRSRIDERDIEVGVNAHSFETITEIGLEIRDVLPTAGEVLYVFLGEGRRMRLSQIRSLLGKALSEASEIEAALTLLLWHGALGLFRDEGDVSYIFDVRYDLRRLRGLLEKGGDGDPLMEVNPALWSHLEMTA